MRLRVSLEISISKRKSEGQSDGQNSPPEPPVTVEGNYARTEIASTAPIGFQIDMPDHD